MYYLIKIYNGNYYSYHKHFYDIFKEHIYQLHTLRPKFALVFDSNNNLKKDY